MHEWTSFLPLVNQYFSNVIALPSQYRGRDLELVSCGARRDQSQARVAWVRKSRIFAEPLSIDTGVLTAP
jgi:hypothetical protein